MKKIVLLGGKNTGKTTIISSILSQLQKQMPTEVCTVCDYTEYAVSGPVMPLKNKSLELHIDLARMERSDFIVDRCSPSQLGSYIYEFNAGNSSLDIEFVDIPGIFMDEGFSGHAYCMDLINQSDVVMVAIDTPYLMNVTDDEKMTEVVNDVCNRVSEITRLLYHIDASSPDKMKQIIFCPVKCEKWMLNGEADKVTDKVKSIYGKLIENLKQFPLIDIWIMPIQTVGGIEFSEMLPALLYFKDEDDRTGQQCSQNPLTGNIIDKDGNVFSESEILRLESDVASRIGCVEIPRSWYKLNGLGYSPRYGEQIGYHILEFLVMKEAKTATVKVPTLFGLFKKMNFDLPVWENVIDRLKELGCVKDEGNVFFHVSR